MSDEASKPAQETPTAGQASTNQASTEVAPAAAGSADQSGAGTAEQKGPQGNQAVVEKYELKLPEGSLLRPEHVEKIALIAKERGLSNENAQLLVEREHQARTEFLNELRAQDEQAKTAWISEVKADKEIGGDNFNRSVETAKRALDRFGSPEFKAMLDDTGYGNHPEVVRIFARIASSMSEDQLVIPGSQAGGSKSIEEIFYGKQD